MKKILSFFFVAAMVTLVACGGKKSDLLAGSWKMGDMTGDMPKEIPDSLKSRMEAQTKQMVEEMKKTASFDFNKDGTYNIKVSGQETKGKWKMSDDASKITMVDDTKDKDREMTGEIVELSATKFVFSMVQQGSKSTLTLVK
jgi:hypothetical protein